MFSFKHPREVCMTYLEHMKFFTLFKLYVWKSIILCFNSCCISRYINNKHQVIQ